MFNTFKHSPNKATVNIVGLEDLRDAVFLIVTSIKSHWLVYKMFVKSVIDSHLFIFVSGPQILQRSWLVRLHQLVISQS